MKFAFGDLDGIRPRHIKDSNILEELGFKAYDREILIFFKEIKNHNGIQNNNFIIESLNCLIINKSISDIFMKDGTQMRHFDKTVYYCGLDLPENSATMSLVLKRPELVMKDATIIPYYGFSTSHITLKNSFIDFKLSLADLSYENKSELFTIMNFSDNEHEPLYKDIIQGNHFNPKYYTLLDANYYQDQIQYRYGDINDFIDDHTNITFNTFGSDKLETFINNEKKTGIYIDKNLTYVNDFIEEVFKEIIFINPDDIEVVCKHTHYGLSVNITKLAFFSDFRLDVLKYYTNLLHSGILKTFEAFAKKVPREVTLIFRISKQFIICDTFFANTLKEIRITKPLYKLYGNFSVKSEEILQSIEENKHYVKEMYLDQFERNRLMIDVPTRYIEDSMNLIDKHVNQLQLNYYENKRNQQKLLE